MQKRTLIFDDSVEGHHLEYIHHLYVDCVKRKDKVFIFILPNTFKLVSNKLQWPRCNNIIFDFISDSEVKKFKSANILKPYYLCMCLKKAIQKHNVSNVFIISLMSLMPFLPFFINRRTKVSGIIYLIYLYRWNNSNLRTRIGDIIKYTMFSQLKIFKNIFLLNDNIAPLYLNKKFNTTVFKYLPDPFMPIKNRELKNLRAGLNIAMDKIICLHFGALTERKGTIEILKAIVESNEASMSKCCFIFAGKINEDIKDSFYLLASKAEKITRIIIYDDYVDYNFIGSLCLTSDFLMIPYKNPEQSSGVMGYAAQFEIPVVGPRIGLLGKLIKRYKLGFLLNNSSSESLKIFLNNIEAIKYKVNSDYIKDKTVSIFTSTIFK